MCRATRRFLVRLIAWAGRNPSHRASSDENIRLGGNILRRMKTSRLAKGSKDIRSYAQTCLGKDCLPFVGAPARVVLVAAGFTDECMEFAELLSERRVAVELLKVDIVRSRDDVYVGRTLVHRDEYADPTWRVLRRVWQQPRIRDRFVLNGWADALNYKSFSLSSKLATDARIWFYASESRAEVWPGGWYKSDSKQRKSLRNKLLDAMPDDVDRSERWLAWEFEWPNEMHEFDKCILKIADAVHNVLASEAPHTG